MLSPFETGLPNLGAILDSSADDDVEFMTAYGEYVFEEEYYLNAYTDARLIISLGTKVA